MADAGSMYYNALSGMGEDIARGMYQYHREHQAYDQQLGIANALSRIGVNEHGNIVAIQPDANGKVDKSIQPVLDPKARDMFTARNRQDWAKSAGALEILSRLGVSLANRMSEQNIEPKFPVTVGGNTYPLNAREAAMAGMRQEENEAQAQAAIPREKRAQRREERADKSSQREDVRLGMAQSAAARTEIEKRPEIQFSRKYGLTPQALIGIQESPYVATHQDKVLGENPPLQPGQTEPAYNKQSWYQSFRQAFGADPTPEQVQWKVKNPDGVFREEELKYGGSAKEGTPARERFRVNPEGQFLNVRGTRIPVGEVSTVQNAANAAQQNLQQTIGSPQFQALPPEQQAAKLTIIKQRLSNLGYNPNDPFWGLPQDQQ